MIGQVQDQENFGGGEFTITTPLPTQTCNAMSTGSKERADVEMQNPTFFLLVQQDLQDVARTNNRKILNVPFAMADATTLAEAGYVW